MAGNLLRAALTAAGKYAPTVLSTLGAATSIKNLFGKSQPIPPTIPTPIPTPTPTSSYQTTSPINQKNLKIQNSQPIPPSMPTSSYKTTSPGSLLGAATKKAKFPLGKIVGPLGTAVMVGDLLTPYATQLGEKAGGMPHSTYTPEMQDLYSAFREGINSNIAGFGGPIKGMADVKGLLQRIVSDAKPALKGANYTQNWNVLMNAASDFLTQSGGALGLGDIDKASAKTILRNVFMSTGGTEKQQPEPQFAPSLSPPSTGFYQPPAL